MCVLLNDKTFKRPKYKTLLYQMYDSGRFTVKDTIILFITTGIFADLSGLIVNFINWHKNWIETLKWNKTD